MPITGRKPKATGESVNRNAPIHDWTEVEDIPFTDGPSLPRKRANGQPWPDWTRKKWAAWSRMPHCSTWTEADWNFALDAIEIAARFHTDAGSSVALATELRNRERVLGTTADYRRDLRIRYVEPKDDRPVLAVVSNADDFRNL